MSLITWLLGKLGIRLVPAKRQPKSAVFFFTLPLVDGVSLKGNVMKLAVGYKDTLTLHVEDAQNDELGATDLPTKPVWSTSDSSTVSITPSDDGMTAEVRSLKAGTGVTVKAVVTSNPDGTDAIAPTFVIDAVAGLPASASITAGTPTLIDQTPVTPPAPPTV